MKGIINILGENRDKKVTIIMVSGPHAATGIVRRVGDGIVVLEGNTTTSHIAIPHIVNVSVPN